MASKRGGWEHRLARVAARLPGDEVHREARGRVTIAWYYCNNVMALARHLRRHARAKDIQAQHDTLKITCKHLQYGTRGRFEVRRGPYRLDIHVDDGHGYHEIIEVKSLVSVTVNKLRGLPVAVMRKGKPDRLWICFFYKFKGGASPDPRCQYLLCWVALDLRGTPDIEAINSDVIDMVQKGKAKVGDKIDVSKDIIIPLENLVMVEELERELEELETKHDEEIDKLYDVIEAKERCIGEQEKRIGEQEKQIAARDEEIAALKRRLGLE